MFRPLQGVDSSISIARIERRYESLQTYYTNVLYIWQNLINTNNIYGTNITKTRNLPRGFILNQFKTLKYFRQVLKYFYIMWHSLIRQLACSQVIQQLASEWIVCIFSQKWNARNKQTSFCYFVIPPYKLRDFIKIYDGYVNDPIKGDFQKTLLLFHVGRKSFMGYKCLWLHNTHKSLLGLYSMIGNQTL